MPRQSPSTSKQNYETPREVLEAVAKRFGALEVDLACEASNAKAPIALAFPAVDSLTVPWAERFPDATMWLNPPFKRIAPWMAKCHAEARRLRRGRIVVLTPASVGSNWFFDHVHGRALVLPLAPRITFVGATQPFPKDCMLSVFSRSTVDPSLLERVASVFSSKILRAGFEPWRWSAVDDDHDEADVELGDVEEKPKRRRRKPAELPS